jgi:hypothetical protein
MLAGIEPASPGHRALLLLHCRALEQHADLPLSSALIRRCGPWEPSKQSHCSSYVLTCPSEVRESIIILNDPSVNVMGFVARRSTVSAMSDLVLELCMFQLKSEARILELLLLRPQPLQP